MPYTKILPDVDIPTNTKKEKIFSSKISIFPITF